MDNELRINMKEEIIRLTAEIESKSREWASSAANGVRIGRFDWDMTAGVVLWSEQLEAIMGYIAPAAVRPHGYRHWADRVHPDDLLHVEEHTKHCVVDRVPCELVYRIIWPDGSLHWVRGYGVFHYDASGEADRMLGIVMEITENFR